DGDLAAAGRPDGQRLVGVFDGDRRPGRRRRRLAGLGLRRRAGEREGQDRRCGCNPSHVRSSYSGAHSAYADASISPARLRRAVARHPPGLVVLPAGTDPRYSANGPRASPDPPVAYSPCSQLACAWTTSFADRLNLTTW